MTVAGRSESRFEWSLVVAIRLRVREQFWATARPVDDEPQAAVARLWSRPDNRVPAGAVCSTLRTADGTMLRFAIWSALPSTARGTVCVLPGRADHIEKYFETITALLARGFAVAMLDWRGQGGSERKLADAQRGHVDRAADYLADFAAFTAEIARRDMPQPLFALAHSMGAAILLNAVATSPESLRGVVMTAPMIALAPGLQPPLAEPIARGLCAAGLARLPLPDPRSLSEAEKAFTQDNLLTSDPVRYARIADINGAAPHLSVRRPTIGWVRCAFDLMRPLRSAEFCRGVSTPILAVAGADDAVTSTPATIALCHRLPRARAIVLDACRHEVLMEHDTVRVAFWRAFDRFMLDLA
jgi:lysophospholipase